MPLRASAALVPWCNGSTRDFDSLCPGSNPGGTIRRRPRQPEFGCRGRFFLWSHRVAVRAGGGRCDCRLTTAAFAPGARHAPGLRKGMAAEKGVAEKRGAGARRGAQGAGRNAPKEKRHRAEATAPLEKGMAMAPEDHRSRSVVSSVGASSEESDSSSPPSSIPRSRSRSDGTKSSSPPTLPPEAA